MLLQSGALPYRVRSGRLEVLLVTSRTRGRWIIPKGHVEPALSPADSAAKEAFEEAGVRGRIAPDALGSYLHDRATAPSVVQVFALDVVEELADWPEAVHRTRRWMPPALAASVVMEDGLRRIIRAFDAAFPLSSPASPSPGS